MKLLDILIELEKVLTTNLTITSYVSTTTDGRPSIYSDLAPVEAEMPYLVVHSSVTPAGEFLDALDYNIEIYDSGTNKAKVIEMVDIIEKALIGSDKSNSALFSNITIFRGGAGMIPTNDIEIQHGHVSCEFRYSKANLYT